MRRHAIWLGLLTAVVTGAAGAAGFPGVPDSARVVLVGLAAGIAGVVAVLQGWALRGEVDHQETGLRQLPSRSLAGQAAPVPQLSRPELFQLPPDVRNFTDQEALVGQITATVARERAPGGGPPVCVISGKGGVGKTVLAVHVAHMLKERFPAGQLYVNLRGLEPQPVDPGEALEEFLRWIGVNPTRIPRRVEDRARVYRARLAEGRFLVVLDNAADEAQIRPLIPWASSCAVLVTSRRRLSGLEGADLLALDVFDREPAFALLESLVGRPRLATELEAAWTVVRLCGYLPLAVKIAGAKLASRPHWRVTRLAERLKNDQFRLGELQIGDVEVRSVMALSYDTRTDQERQVFRRLGLLRAPTFPAWAVSALVERGLAETEDLLENLAEVHLVEVAGGDAAGQVHYRLHDLLRDFARERVLDEEDPVSRDAALRRYVSAYLAVATEARLKFEPGSRVGADVINGGEWRLPAVTVRTALPDDPIEWFSSERTNLSAVVQQAFDSSLATLGWPLLDRLSPFFEHQAYWDIWHSMAQAALAAAEQSGNRGAEAQARYELGWVARFEGRFSDSAEQLHASSSVFSELGDQHGQAKSLSALGVVLQDSGQWREAISTLETSIALFQEVGDRRWEARTRQELGVLYRLQGEWVRAISLFEMALAQYRELGDRSREARALRSLGDVYYEQGRLEDAQAALDAVLPLFRQLGDRRWEATTSMRIGEVHGAAGRLDEALAAFSHARPMLEEFGDRRWEAMIILRTGEVYARQDRTDDALTAFSQALPVFQELGDRRFVAITRLDTGEAQLRQGRVDDALAAFDQALVAFEELGDRVRTAEALRARGRARLAEGERVLAVSDLRAALGLFERLERASDVHGLQAELAGLDPV